MVSQVVQNTFVSTYKDDFRDSDNYYRILFNTGRALQARELTQLQTIIQKEIERFGRYVFNEGSVITSNLGTSATRSFAAHYVKLDTSTNPLPTDYASLENTFVTNDLASPVTANIIKVIPATGADPATLVLTYTDGGDNSSLDTTTPLTFLAGQNLTTDSGTLTIQTIDTVANPAVGRTSLITIPENEVFSLGHFVYTPKQTLVLSKYSDEFNGVIGYKVTESIVTVSDDLALYDNAGSTPNLTSPGADRYRIVLTLIDESDVAAGETFIPLIKMRNGNLEILQNTDNILNRLGDTLATRTSEINGNFVTREKQGFNLQVLQDSDNDYLRYVIRPGTAYVKGYRISTTENQEFRVKKPRTDPTDILRIPNPTLATKFGNYFLADSMYGMLGLIDSNATVNIYDSADLANTKIGTARVRHIDKLEDKFRIYVHSVSIDSNGSGSFYDITTARSLGLSATNKANLLLTDNQQNVKIQEPGNGALLFNLQYAVPYEVGQATMEVAEVFSTTTTGAGKGVFNTSAVDEVFAQQADWILKYDSDGAVVTSLTVESGGVGSTSVRIGGLTASQDVQLLAYVNITADPISVSIQNNQTSTGSLTNNQYIIPSVNVHRLISVVDNTTSQDITYKFVFERKSSLDFKDVSVLKLKGEYSAPAGTITVTYNDHSEGSGDYYNVNSYSSYTYSEIPFVPGDGVSLNNQLDFRPSKNTSGTGFSGSGSKVLRLPRNNSVINFDYIEYYKGRTDTIYIDPYSRSIKLLQGENEGVYAEPQNLPGSILPLHQIALNPYTYTNEDLTRIKYSHKHYKQDDISSLDTRISNLEELTALSLLEANAINVSVTDAEGRERTKLGVTADPFLNHSQSLVKGNVEFRASIDMGRGMMRPKQVRSMVPLWYDSDNSTGIKRFNNVLLPKFTENVLINQTVASRSTDVNQLFVPRFVGSMTLNPDHDYWTERRTVDNGTTKVVFKNGDVSSYDKFQEYGG